MGWFWMGCANHTRARSNNTGVTYLIRGGWSYVQRDHLGLLAEGVGERERTSCEFWAHTTQTTATKNTSHTKKWLYWSTMFLRLLGPRVKSEGVRHRLLTGEPVVQSVNRKHEHKRCIPWSVRLGLGLWSGLGVHRHFA